MREHISDFDRFWNSTFGLPQQYLMRMLRVMQDDRVDLFSKQGVLDLSLIPVLGIFDSDRYDVGTEEKFKRTLGALGVKDSWGARLATEVLTDPMTFMTAGLTAGAKGAMAVNKARNVSVMKRGISGVDSATETVGAFRNRLQTQLANGGGKLLDFEQRQLLNEAFEATRGLDESKAVNEVLKDAGRREIQLGLPILNGYGAVIWKNEAYHGWTRFLLDKTKATPLTTGLAEATRGMVSGNPTLNKALTSMGKTWTAVRDGVAGASSDLRAFQVPDGVAPPAQMRAFTDRSRAIYMDIKRRGADNVKAAFARSMAMGDIEGAASANRAVQHAMPEVKGAGYELWDELTGKAVTEAGLPTLESFGKAVDEFMGGYEETVKYYQRVTPTDVPTARGLQQKEAAANGKLKVYEAARSLTQGWRKVFTSDVGNKEFFEGEKAWRTQSAFYQQAVEEMTLSLVSARAAAAKEAGLSVDELNQRVMKFQEAHAMQDELQDRLLAIQQNPQSVEAADALQNYATRFINVMSGLKKLISNGKGNPFDSAILANMEPVFRQTPLDGDTLKAVMSGLHQTVEKWAPELTGQMDSYGSYQVLTGSRRGSHLQFIPDKALMFERQRLLKALDGGLFPFGSKAASSVVEDVPELKSLRDRFGLENQQVIELAQASRNVNKFRAAAQRVVGKLNARTAQFSEAAALEGAAASNVDEAHSEFAKFTQSENRLLTRQMMALNALEATVGEWKAEVALIKEQITAAKSVGNRASRMWEEAYSGDLGAVPRGDLFTAEMNLAVKEYRAEVKAFAKQHQLSTEDALAALESGDAVHYVEGMGNVPIDAAARAKVESALNKIGTDERLGFVNRPKDKRKFDIARAAIGAEDKVTRQLRQLLKVRQEEIAEWGAGIPTLKADIAAIQAEIKSDVKARRSLVKGTEAQKKEALRRRQKLGREMDRIQERVALLQKKAAAEASFLGHEFDVSTDAVESLAANFEGVRGQATRALYGGELKRIDDVLRRRKSGESKYVPIPRSSTHKFPLGARRIRGLEVERDSVDSLINELDLDQGQAVYVDSILGGNAGKEMVDTGEAVHNALSLVVLAKEFRRAANAGTSIPLDLHKIANETIQHNSEIMEKVFYGAAGEAGTHYLKSLDEVRRFVHASSWEGGLVTAASPIAYAPRVKGFKESHLLDQLLNDSEFYQVIDTSQPRLGPLIRRDRDSLSVSDLNLLSQAINDAAGPKATAWRKVLDEFAVANGYSAGFREYSEDGLLNLMNRFAQGQRVNTTADFAAQMFLKGEQDLDELTLVGARVIEVVQGAGQDVSYGETLRFGAAKQSGTTMTVPVEVADQAVPQLRGMKVLTAGGRDMFVSAETLAMHRGSVLNMRQPDFGPWRKRALEHGETPSGVSEPAMAFAHLAARGQLNASDMVHNIDEALQQIKAGDYIAFGNRDVIANTLGTIQGQWKHFSPVVNAYDTAHHLVKRLQTVYRPTFLVGNTVSAYPQSLIAGASPAAAARGYWHAGRFMSQSADLSRDYDRFATISSSGKGGVEGVLRDGTEFIRVLRRNPSLKDVPWADEVAFRVGGQEFTFREMAPHLRELLLTSATREGLRGGSRLSGALQRLGDGKELGVLGKADEAVATAAESVETYNRLTTWFALVDDGMPLDRATRNALDAHINYADLTNIERRHFKRYLGFYAWTRKMTPFLAKKFVDSPGAAAALAGAIRSDAITEDENGQMVVDMGKVRLAIDRLNPALDTLRMVETAGEMLIGTGAAFGAGDGVHRQEQISGQNRAPFSFGGLSGIVLTGLQGNREGDGTYEMMRKARDTFWASRMVLGDGGDKTAMEQIMEQLIPVKAGDGKAKANSIFAGRARGVIADLRRKAEETTDLDHRTRLYEEINRLNELAISLERQ